MLRFSLPEGRSSKQWTLAKVLKPPRVPNQYELIYVHGSKPMVPYLGGYSHINPSYFDVHQRYVWFWPAICPQNSTHWIAWYIWPRNKPEKKPVLARNMRCGASSQLHRITKGRSSIHHNYWTWHLASANWQQSQQYPVQSTNCNIC